MFFKRAVIKKLANPQKNTLLESLFNSRYCEIFKKTYFEEHLPTTASENVLMKLRKKKIVIKTFLTLYYSKETSEKVYFYFMKETSENACFYFMIGFLWSLYSDIIFL